MDDLLESVGKAAGEILVESAFSLVVGENKEKLEDEKPQKNEKVKESNISDYVLLFVGVFIVIVLVGSFIALLWLFVF